MLAHVRRDLRAEADPVKAAFFPRFFKTGKGDYAEGDRFLGVTVPKIRAVAKRYRDLPRKDVDALLKDPVHEYRLLALFILVEQFKRADDRVRAEIVTFYLSRRRFVNNWDLVDSSAYAILGEHLVKTGETATLDRLARSDHLWTQRVAVVATLAFIRGGDVKPILRLAPMFFSHPHDLLHKAVGWMLREAGKRDLASLQRFLDRHAKNMPRTMLRYAIEKFPMEERKQYLMR